MNKNWSLSILFIGCYSGAVIAVPISLAAGFGLTEIALLFLCVFTLLTAFVLALRLPYGRPVHIWRLLNTALLLGSFLGPWMPTCIFCFSSFGPPESGLLFVLDFLVPIIALPIDLLGIFFLTMLSGVICIWLYALMNIMIIVDRTEWRRGRLILLAGSLMGTMITALWIMPFQLDYQPFLWGFWLLWVGLISSTVLESVSLVARRDGQLPASTFRGGQIVLAHRRATETEPAPGDERERPTEKLSG